MSARTIKAFQQHQRRKVTPGSYLLKLKVKKDGTWKVEVAGRWAKRTRQGETFYEMVDAPLTTQLAIGNCLRNLTT